MKQYLLPLFLFAGLTIPIAFADDPVPPKPPAPIVNPVVVVPVAPTITLPAEIKADVGAFVEIAATTNCDVVQWYVMPMIDAKGDLVSPGLNLFPMDLLKDTKTAVGVATKEGIYFLHAYTAKDNIPSKLQTCKIIIGNPPPVPVPVPPGPNPPGPNPPPPNPVKLSVLFIDEHSDYGKAEYKAYLGVINSTKLRDYLNSHCALELNGIPTWRKWDQNTDISHESGSWQKLFSVKRDTLPWLIVADGQGNVFYSGKVPNDVASTLTLLQKYGGS